jgi:hypothetical protein
MNENIFPQEIYAPLARPHQNKINENGFLKNYGSDGNYL